MKLVIHAADEDATCEIQGHVFRIPPRKAFRIGAMFDMDHNNNGPVEAPIPEETVCQRLVERCWYFGLVEVPVLESEGQLGPEYRYDIPAALEVAKERLIVAEEQILGNYVKVSQDRMSQQLPAMPPNGRAKYIIEKRGIDLKKSFNITPVGYDTVRAASSHDDEIAELRRRNEELRKQFEQVMAALPKKSKPVEQPVI